MVNEKILFIYVNPINYPPAPPKGIEILTAFLLENGFSIDIIYPFQESFQPYKFIRSFLKKRKYLFIGLSFRNFDNAGFHFKNNKPTNYFNILQKVIRTLIEIDSSVPLILGGSGFSFDPITQLKKLKLHFGVKGVGEHAIVEFANLCKSAISKEDLIEKVRGRILKNKLPGFILYDLVEGVLICDEKKVCVEPQYYYISHEWNYALSIIGGTTPIRTKIGCIKRCNYCVVPLFNDFSNRQISTIVDEIKTYKNLQGNKRFFFADSETNFPDNNWLKELLMEITTSFGEYGIEWEGYIYPIINGFAELAPFIKKSGCHQINLTVDALDNEILQKMDKDYTVEEVIEIIQILKSNHINVRLNILLGSIGERRETINNQIALIKYFSKENIKITINIGLRVYPNTNLSKHILNSNELKTYMLSPFVFCSQKSINDLGTYVYNKLKNYKNVIFTQERDLTYEKFCKYLFIGAISLERKNFKKSELAFKKALSFNIETFRPKLGLARNYLESGKLNQAELLISEIEQ